MRQQCHSRRMGAPFTGRWNWRQANIWLLRNGNGKRPRRKNGLTRQALRSLGPDSTTPGFSPERVNLIFGERHFGTVLGNAPRAALGIGSPAAGLQNREREADSLLAEHQAFRGCNGSHSQTNRCRIRASFTLEQFKDLRHDVASLDLRLFFGHQAQPIKLRS